MSIGFRHNPGCPAVTACRGGRGALAHGISVAELLVICGIVGLLTALLLSGISRTRQVAQSARCLTNLHAIAVAFNQYALDSEGRYPDPLAADASWESLLRPYLSQSQVFACPGDTEVFPAVGSSYDWRDNPNPLSSLAGRRLVDVFRPEAVLAFESLPGWHGSHVMNAVLVNGSAVTMSDDECLGDLSRAVFGSGGTSPPAGGP